MREARPLPSELPSVFSVERARALGVSPARLRGGHLARPFCGVREVPDAAHTPPVDPYLRQREALVAGAHRYAPRLHGTQHFSHETAVALWGGPLPLRREHPVEQLPVHVSVLDAAPLPRLDGVTAHRARSKTTRLRNHEGLVLSSPSSTWASMGHLSLHELVALGDYFCRVWRAGVGRPDVGRMPLTTVPELRAAIAAGKRVGNPKLREAVELIREDAWSPRETVVRMLLLDAGLPEPELNLDVFDDGRFLGCLDLAYPSMKVAIEYHGVLHADSYARDVERMAALRAAGWTVIEVTSELLAASDTLIARVRRALRHPRI